MSATTKLAITHMDPGQNQKEVRFNEAMDKLDGYVGAQYTYNIQTDNYTVTADDFRVAMNAATSKTFTMTGTPKRAGQAWELFDMSGALISNAATVTIAVPTGWTLDGVTNGTLVIYADNGMCEIVYTGGTAYVVVFKRGVLDSVDERVGLNDWLGTPSSDAANNIALPTASNHIPGYIPFCPPYDIGIDQIIFPFGAANPSSDASDASIRYGIYSSSNGLPATLLWAVEDAKLQGTGHLRSTSDITFGNIGSVTASIAAKTLSARRFLKRGRVYFLAYHLQPTFSAGQGIEIMRRSLGLQTLMLNAGAQAWPYTMANSPTVATQFSGNTLQRLVIGIRFRRVL